MLLAFVFSLMVAGFAFNLLGSAYFFALCRIVLTSAVLLPIAGFCFFGGAWILALPLIIVWFGLTIANIDFAECSIEARA